MPIHIVFALSPFLSLFANNGTNGLLLYTNILQLIEASFGAVALVGIASITEKTIQGHGLSWKDALRHGMSRWGNAIGTGILAQLTILLWSFLIIPGIIWSVNYTFSFWVYAVALRNMGGKKALDYSKNLVEGQWWRVFWIGLVIAVSQFIIRLAITYSIGQISTNQFYSVLPNTLEDILGALFTIMTTVFFLNLEQLKQQLSHQEIKSDENAIENEIARLRRVKSAVTQAPQISTAQKDLVEEEIAQLRAAKKINSSLRCQNCGSPLRVGAEFCTQCGTRYSVNAGQQTTTD